MSTPPDKVITYLGVCTVSGELKGLIIKLSKEVNDKNYNDIIIFFQKNNYDVNNKLIDQIVREYDENLKSNLISKLQNDTGIDFTSTG